MNSISGETMEKFCMWAKENNNKEVFPKISEDRASYYDDRQSEDTYMIEYSFKTMQELKYALENYSALPTDSGILKMITIETCQYRVQPKLEFGGNAGKSFRRSVENKNGKELPDFIYVF